MTDLGPVGRVRAAAHTRHEQTSYDAAGRPTGRRVLGEVQWDEAPADRASITAFYARNAGPWRHAVAFACELAELVLAFALVPLSLVVGGFFGYFCAPGGAGMFGGAALAFLAYCALAARATYQERL